MHIFEAILLGILQGLTEFLPVSSSAHLRIASELLGLGDTGAAFTAITQLGTEAAVIVFFWRDIVRIISRWALSLSAKRVPRNDPDAKLGWWIILGSIPIVALGLLCEDLIESTLRSLWFTAITLILFGVLLGFADRMGKRELQLTQLRWRHGVAYGLAQALALIPGVSRSGGTITAGLLLGYTREAAARYSFLLAIPAVIGSGGYKLVQQITGHADGVAQAVPMPLTLLAAAIAFAVALVVIGGFMRYIQKRSFMPFVIYRVLLGGSIIVLLLSGVLSPGGVASGGA